jgi:hypothetical protein
MRYFLLVISVLLLVFNSGCNEESPTNTDIQPGNGLVLADSGPSGAEVLTSGKFAIIRISGVGFLPNTVEGDIQNTRVALYTSVQNWNFDITYAFTACDGSGNYTMSGIVPGDYYMDAWRDNDNNGVWGSSGDYIWVNGSGGFPNYTLEPIRFCSGTTTVDFELFVVP